MDTKLKNYETKYYGIVMSSILETIAISLAVIAGTVFLSISEMRYFDGEDPGYYHAGNITNPARFARLEEISGVATIIAALATVFFAIIFIALVCKNAKSASQKVRWFEKAWTEIKLAILAGGVGIIVASGVMFNEIWFNGEYLGIWETASEVYTPSIVVLVLAFCLLIIGIVVTLFEFGTLVSRIRKKSFFKKSLIGGAIIYVYKLFVNSDRTMLKVLILLIGGAFLSVLWIGLPVVLALILLLVPKQVSKYEAIKTGISEIRDGNLDYKIDVEMKDGQYKSELDELADAINDISNASYIAFQNEIKNQKLKSELISNVSHDIKTPLTSMISYVHLLKSEGLDSENAEEYLEIIDDKTKRLKTLTENLFEAAKASSGDIPVNMEVINLSSLITQSLAEMDERFQDHNLEVKINNNYGEVYVNADGQLLHRVLENLFGNIAKYALEGSRVYIDINEGIELANGDRKFIRLDVKNISRDALNIPADELLERFKRGDESRNTEGSGLGLAIANDLVKLMNGRLKLNIDGDLFKATILLELAKKEPAYGMKSEPLHEADETLVEIKSHEN